MIDMKRKRATRVPDSVKIKKYNSALFYLHAKALSLISLIRLNEHFRSTGNNKQKDA
jgi:hypothetical protein